MEGKRSITDIALAVGFSTPAHFSAAFKAQYGRTPKAHRAGLSPKTRKNPIVASGRTVHTQPETGGTTACTAFCTTACTVREYPALRIDRKEVFQEPVSVQLLDGNVNRNVEFSGTRVE